MATSSAAIANLALGHLGASAVVITTLSSDTTLEGKACNAFYETAKRETLLAHPWNVAQQVASLTYIGEITAEPIEWGYKYRLPEDCLMPQRIVLNASRNQPSGLRIPYRLYRDSTSTTWSAATTYATGEYSKYGTVWYRALRETVNDQPDVSASDWVATSTYSGVPPQWLVCDVYPAWLEYTVDISDPREFTPDLDNAIAAKLAFYVAPKVSNKDAGLREEMARLWAFLVGQARENDITNQQRDEEPRSSFEIARDIGLY